MDRLDASKCLHAPRQNSLDVCLCQLFKHPPSFCIFLVVEGGGELRTLVRWWSYFPPPLPPQQYGRGGAPKYRPFTIALYGYPLYTDKCLRNADDVTSISNRYCTGGIRCERGSAALKELGVCKDVYQLEGGVHKYLEEFPDGHFRGKLYVFDNRQTIATNDDVISTCAFCPRPCDKLELCGATAVNGCRNLMLSCVGCRIEDKIHCCTECRSNAVHGTALPKAGCACVRARRT